MTENIVYANCEIDNYELPRDIPSEGSIYYSPVDIGEYLTISIHNEIPEFETDLPIYWVEILVIDWDNGTAQNYFDSVTFCDTAYDYYYENLDVIMGREGLTLAEAASEGMTEEDYRDYISTQAVDSLMNSFGHDVLDSTSIEVV